MIELFKENIKKDIKKKIFWSVMVGMTAAALLQGPKLSGETPLHSWWGCLYPQYCFSEIPQDDTGEPAQVRFKFRWLHGV